MNKVILVVALALLVAVAQSFKVGKQFPSYGGYHGGYRPPGGYHPGHHPGYGGYQPGPGAYGRPPYHGGGGGFGGAGYPYYPSQQAAIHGGHGFGAYGTGYGR